jgi:hypothetical protein
MLLPGAVAGAASFCIVPATVVAIGFMVRFFVALAGDQRRMRSGPRVQVEAVPWWPTFAGILRADGWLLIQERISRWEC